MENKSIILILLVVIVILAAAVGFVLFNPTSAKAPTQINITSDGEQYEGGELNVRVEIENTGKMAADEPVLVYIRDEVATVPQPVKRLVAVERVRIEAGEKKAVRLRVPKEKLMFTGLDMKKRLESGYFTVTSENISTRIYISE